MKSQIVTTLSVIAVLGAAGGAFAANSSVLTTASSEPSVIGTATPVLVPIAPKGADIPDDYRQRLADAAGATLPGGTGSTVGAASDDVEQVAPAQPAPPADGTNGGSGSYSDDDDHDEDEDEDHDEDEDDEDEDESDDDD
jgi:hypothetical protein